MWTLTGFADEISPDLDVQLDTLAADGIRHLEFRGVWDKNCLKLSDEELERVKSALDQRGVRVSCIGSPIGKVNVDSDFAAHLVEFRRAIAVAHKLGAPYIRIFSFFLPEGDDPARHREVVLERMGALVRAAAGEDVILLHENERHIYGDVPSRCWDLLRQINSPLLRAAWDPANFVQVGVRPHSAGYTDLRPYIRYIHIKDAVLATGQVVPAGQGDSQLRETLAALYASGFDGFFSLEPHLQSGGTYAGFSGPELFRTAVAALQGLLNERKIPWA